MKTLFTALSLLLLPSLLSAQSFDDLLAAFPSYELGTTIEDEALIEAMEKTVPKDLMKAFLLEYGGDWATLNLENDDFQWHPLAHVQVSDDLHVFALTTSTPTSNDENNQNIIEFVTVHKEAYQDHCKMAADLDPAVDGTVSKVSLTIEEDRLYTTKNLLFTKEYEGASTPYDLAALKQKAADKGEDNLERFTFNKKGKLKEDYRWWKE